MQTLRPSQEVFQRCEAADIQLTEEGEPNSLAQLLVYPRNLEMSWEKHKYETNIHHALTINDHSSSQADKMHR